MCKVDYRNSVTALSTNLSFLKKKCILQLFNLSEKRYDISKLNPKVSWVYCFMLSNYRDVGFFWSYLCSCVFVWVRFWILAGRTITLQLWIRSAASAKLWTLGWMLTVTM